MDDDDPVVLRVPVHLQPAEPERAVSLAEAYAVERCLDEMCVCTRSRSA